MYSVDEIKDLIGNYSMRKGYNIVYKTKEGGGYLVCLHNAGFYSNVTITLDGINDAYRNFGIRKIDFIDWAYSHNFYGPPRYFDYLDIYKNYPDISKEKLNLNPISVWNRTLYKYIKFDDYIIQSNALDPSINIQSKIIELQMKYAINPEETLGVYYRGGDKAGEVTLPCVECWAESIIWYLKNKYKKVLLQTDNLNVLNKFYALLKGYEDRIIVISENPHCKEDNKTVFNARNLTVPNDNNRNRKEEIFYLDATMRILSTLPTLLLSTSNISLFIIMYRKNCNGIFQSESRTGNLIPLF
jgi:hypothetical protein